MEKVITKICVLSDNEESTVETLLQKSFPGVLVDTLSSEGNYLHTIRGKNYSIILSECSLKNKNSLDVLDAIQKMECEVPVIVLGECENEEIAIESMRKGAYDYILKTEKFTNTLPIVVERTFKKYLEGKGKKLLELKLKNSEKRYRTLIESMHDGVFMVNRDLQIVMANRSLIDQLKGKMDEVVGKRCHEVLQKTSRPCEGKEHPCPTREVFNTGKPVSVIHCHLSRSGDNMFEEVNAYPIINEKGEVTHAVEVLRDITEKKKMEEKMLEQEKLSVLMEMAGATAHELNQPLAVILPRMERSLARVKEHATLHKEMTAIYEQCVRMADLIKKISEITTYKTKPYVGDVNIIDIDEASQPFTVNHTHSLHNLLAPPAHSHESLFSYRD